MDPADIIAEVSEQQPSSYGRLDMAVFASGISVRVVRKRTTDVDCGRLKCNLEMQAHAAIAATHDIETDADGSLKRTIAG